MARRVAAAPQKHAQPLLPMAKAAAGQFSGRKGPQKIGDVVAELLARRGYAQVQQADAFAAAWAQVAGKLAAHSRPGNNRGGVLEVVVRSSLALQELTFQKRQLVSQLNQLLPDQKIRSLKLKVGSLE